MEKGRRKKVDIAICAAVTVYIAFVVVAFVIVDADCIVIRWRSANCTKATNCQNQNKNWLLVAAAVAPTSAVIASVATTDTERAPKSLSANQSSISCGVSTPWR